MKTLTAVPDDRTLLSSRVVSVPTGEPAYDNGYIQCHHIAEFVYPDCVRTLEQRSTNSPAVWKLHPVGYRVPQQSASQEAAQS